MEANDTNSTGGPAQLKYGDFLADHNACLGEGREQHWYGTFDRGGFVEVLEYNAVCELLADDMRMGAYLGGYVEDLMRQNPALSPEHIEAMRATGDRALINMDGPEHQRLRSLVSRNFTPRSVAKLAPFLEECAGELAREMEPGGDFMQGFARALPARALCRLTGIPEEDRKLFVGWIDVLEVQGSPKDLLTLTREQSELVLTASNELRAYACDLIARRRREPQDDLVSRLVNDPEARADDAAIEQLLVDLIFAGNDTTRNALGMMMITLAECPHAWEAVARDPARAPALVEEVLRFESPAPGPVRKACMAFDYRERTFPAGEVSALSIWSANRDREFWGPTADQFDPERPQSGQHVSFGHGPHFCLGASLAREELRAALVVLSAAITNVRVLDTPPMQPAGSIYGPISLRLGFEWR